MSGPQIFSLHLTHFLSSTKFIFSSLANLPILSIFTLLHSIPLLFPLYIIFLLITARFNPDSRGRSVAHIGKVVPSSNESASRESNTRSHSYTGVAAHLPAQPTIHWFLCLFIQLIIFGHIYIQVLF